MSFVRGVVSCLACILTCSLSAQVGSVTLRELTITPEGSQFRTLAGVAQTFSPGESNTLVVNPPVDFVNRSAKVTALLDYSFDLQRETTSGALVSCSFTVPEFPNEPGTNFVVRVDEGSSSGGKAGFTAVGRMQLAEGIARQYTFRCRVADPANLKPLAEETLVVEQRYEPLDTIRIVRIESPAPTDLEPLVPGSTQTFTAQVEYTRDVIRLGSLAVLVATDSSGQELVARRMPQRTNPSAQTVSSTGDGFASIDLTLPDVPIPEDGFVTLHAELVNGRQFGEFEAAQYLTYVKSDPIPYGEESEVDYSIWHIEMNQVVQDDENLIPMVADKPAVARVFVRTPVSPNPGEPSAAPVTVTLRRDGQEHVVNTFALATLPSASSDLFALRNFGPGAATVPIPLEMTRPGTLEIEAAVNLENGEPVLPESNVANNTSVETFKLFERQPLGIGWISIDIRIDPGVDSKIRQLFPLSPTRGLGYFELGFTARTPAEALIETAILAQSGIARMVVFWMRESGSDVENALLVGLHATNVPNVVPIIAYSKANSTRLATGVSAKLLGESILPSSQCPSAADSDFGGVGMDTAHSVLVRLSAHKDLAMGCRDQPDVWISPSRYARLFLRDFGAQPAALGEESPGQSAGDLAVISGEIRADGSGSLNPLLRFQGTPAPPTEPSGEYCVDTSGPGGSARHCWTPDFGASNALPFAVVVPADRASSAVTLSRNGVTLASLTASANPPAVSMVSPSSGASIDAGAPLEVSWNASDPDGDSLRSSLFVSSDGGATWLPLATNLEERSTTIDPARIRGGEQVLIRVVVSDGLLTAQDETGPLTLLQNPAAEIPGNFDLGESAAGVRSTDLIPIESTGTGPLRILSAELDNPAFEIASGLPLDLLPGTPGGLAIAVTPPSSGAHTATLTLETNTGAPVVVQLSATGLDPAQPILNVAVDGDSISFPDTTAGGAAEATVSLLNQGRMPLSYQATVEGAGFSLEAGPGVAQSGGSLAANQQDDLIVRFAPGSAGEFSGALRITSDAPNLGERVIPLTGRGVAAASAPAINPGGVVDAASFHAKLARGGITSLFGAGLATEVSAATDLPLPTSLGGVQVLVDGSPAPLFFVSPGQINFQTPFEAPREGSVQVAVTNGAGVSASVSTAIAPYAPALFANPATGEPIVTRPDNSLITAQDPAMPGDVLVLFVTGIGDLDHPPASGAAAGADPLARAISPPTVTVGGAAAQVLFAGLAPGFVGLAQINIQLPDELASEGGAAELSLEFEGNVSVPVRLPLRSTP